MIFIHLILLVQTSKKIGAARKAIINIATIMCKENIKDLLTTLTMSLSFYQVTDNFLFVMKNIMIMRIVE